MRLQLHSGAIRLHTDEDEVIALPISLPQLLQQSGLGVFPPNELALEQAINRVEDALMPQVAALQRHPTSLLLGSGTCVDMLVAHAAGAQASEASRDAVERVFNRVAAVAGGLPARSQDIAEDAEFIAALVVIRELMHHVGYQTLRSQH